MTLEQHYSIPQIARQWSLSPNTVRRIFFNEPGVLRIGQPSRLLGGQKKKYKRHYFTLRIPESVLLRVQARRTQSTEERGEPQCDTHPGTKLVCPLCNAAEIGAKGGASTALKYGHDQLSVWGKSGGRPRGTTASPAPRQAAGSSV
jgi:hypothetical protein